MKTLKEIVNNTLQITQLIIESDGEINQEIEKVLSINELELSGKVDAYAHVLDRLKNEMEFWKCEKDKVTKVEKSFKNALDYVKNALKEAMIKLEKDELVGEQKRLKISNAKATLVIDELELDPAYFDVVQTQIPAKDRIRQDLLMGLKVKGAHLEDNYTLKQYYNNKK